MARTTLIWGFLLVAGTFLLDTSAQIPSNNTQKILSGNLTLATQAPTSTTKHAALNTTIHAPNTTIHAPNTTIHAPNTTTHAPNTTTHAPNTTTHAPNTTTHAPNTTTHAPNTTTHAPNTTTHAPFNTTTHIIPTLPPKPSPPEIGNYRVNNSAGTCIIADIGLELELENTVDKTTVKRYLNIVPKYTTAKGTCGDSKSNLLLQFPEGSINFIFVKEKKTYYIEEVSVLLSVASLGQWNVTSGNLKLLSADVGYSVKCKRTPTVNLGNTLKLVLADVKLQAFEIKDGTFGKEEMCSYDRNMTAVAIAIVVVVLIVLAIVIYFIWQKKRSSGYQRI